jgi:hypothetical protein
MRRFALPHSTCAANGDKWADHYSDLHVQRAATFPAGLHAAVGSALEALLSKQVLTEQVITIEDRTFPTSLQRLFFGDGGITYKYFDRRMFALPWDAPLLSTEHSNALLSLRTELEHATMAALEKGPLTGAGGGADTARDSLGPEKAAGTASAQFNLLLVNLFRSDSIYADAWKSDQYHDVGYFILEGPTLCPSSSPFPHPSIAPYCALLAG